MRYRFVPNRRFGHLSLDGIYYISRNWYFRVPDVNHYGKYTVYEKRRAFFVDLLIAGGAEGRLRADQARRVVRYPGTRIIPRYRFQRRFRVEWALLASDVL